MNDNKTIPLSKDIKILLLKILKSGVLTKEQSEQIMEPFEHQMTMEEARAFQKKLNDEI